MAALVSWPAGQHRDWACQGRALGTPKGSARTLRSASAPFSRSPLRRTPLSLALTLALALALACGAFGAPAQSLSQGSLSPYSEEQPQAAFPSVRRDRSAAATWQGGDTWQGDTRQEGASRLVDLGGWQGRGKGSAQAQAQGKAQGQEKVEAEVEAGTDADTGADAGAGLGAARGAAVVVSIEDLLTGNLPGPRDERAEASSADELRTGGGGKQGPGVPSRSSSPKEGQGQGQGQGQRQGQGQGQGGGQSPAVGRRRLWSDVKWEYREVKRRRRGGDCWSRNEQHLFYRSFPMTEELEEALRSYQEMHQRCTNVTDWNHNADMLYWDKDKERGTLQGCQYVIFVDPLGHGLGNRIINLISTFAYALVTKRALLMKDDSPIFDFFCNPFKHSSWGLGPAQWKAFIDNLWKGVRRINAIKDGNIFDSWTDRRMMHMGINWNSAEIAGTFFCPENHEQVFKKVPVISIESDEYYVPALYYIPELDRELRRLMPDGRVFLHLSRFLLHPTNRIWLQVTRFYDAYLAHHNRLVGIQVRSFWPCADPVEGRVMDCAFNVSGAVPRGTPTQEFVENLEDSVLMQTSGRGRESVGVFVTSLNRTYADILADYANSHVPPEGQLVGVYSLSHEGHEKHDYRQYEVALVEMMLLSICDELLTTDYSTFGYVAAGVSGTLPYSMNIVVTGGGDFRTNGRPVCQAISSEPCFHRFPSETLTCKNFSQPIAKIHPDVDVCDAVGTGLMHKIIV